MAAIISDNILSPLGFTTEDNLRAIRSGKSALCHYESTESIPFPVTASIFTKDQISDIMVDGLTKFESMAIRSIQEALSGYQQVIDDRCFLVISSTKGNVGNLNPSDNPDNITDLGLAARKISCKLGLTQDPIVISNACISGVSALILANRLIETQCADTVIVCGIDEQSPFIISGFESLKSLSESECRPFDIERVGLNLGEAAATIILSNKTVDNKCWNVVNGVVRNDAFHISSPSPQGEGAYLSLQRILEASNIEDIAVINAHGTATMFNDQMESKAISRAGLSDIPTNALKGYFGHTMGASGVLETILTIHATEQGIVLGTKNFEELGVSGKVNISSKERLTDKPNIIKMISGFGGCNAAIIAKHGKADVNPASRHNFSISHRVILTPNSLSIDGLSVEMSVSGNSLLTSLYKERIADYPKFYKMDSLSKLGFLATEILLQTDNSDEFENTPSRGIAFFNQKASLKTDLAYLETIRDKENFFPSPSLFVYTLPNIVTGEIAIHHHYFGETTFYILPEKNWDRINDIISCMFCDSQTHSVIAGWVEFVDSENFEANIFIANKIN